MRRWTIGGLLALLLSVGLAGDVRPPVVEAQPVEELDVGALIDAAAAAYGQDAALMRKISSCESGQRPWASNRSGASGLFQMMPGTWRTASWGAGYGGASPFDAEANAFSAAWLLRWYGTQPWVSSRGCWARWW